MKPYRIVLAPEAFDALVRALEDPRPPTPALVQAFRRHRSPWSRFLAWWRS